MSRWHFIVDPAGVATAIPAGTPVPAWLNGSLHVLQDVLAERTRQVARYGFNEDLEDGTGPATRWLGPFTGLSAADIERDLRADYEDWEDTEGKPTWVHLLREELAEAFMEDDPAKLYAEVIQVAALAVSWCERMRSRELADVRNTRKLLSWDNGKGA